MTTMQSTVKRADSEQYNDIAIIIKIMWSMCSFVMYHSFLLLYLVLLIQFNAYYITEQQSSMTRWVNRINLMSMNR
jgi:hypothetical protein